MGRKGNEEDQSQEQAQEHIGSSHDVPQPSMFDLMEQLQSINVNIGRNHEIYQRNFTRMDRRLRRLDSQMQGIYAHLGIPPQSQEDEDED
ncbi:hypothetical protein PIB30_101157 [Stylosanthes scabra]|uniref:Uncharacterized protein n=1 Tax=Stylosanthes scabra TaxID=79078 RepID=A0ABU6UW94_9FABA|nr:hypothetical protein [Stylosanthes scabra]